VGLSWKTPLAVPFATRWAVVMLREAYVPVVIDDFDFRAISDVLIVFSCFAWLSFRRSFQPHHFLVAALGSWASYYFAAGVAKWNYGPPHSWLLENHLSNLGASAYIRGWLAFLDEDVVMGAIAIARRMDVAMAGFAFVVELGALVGFFIHERLTRLFFWLCFLFHIGIFVVSGIFFWKWMATNVIFYFWLKRGGAPFIKRVFRHRAVALFGILTIYFSLDRIWYFPQTRVVWYDTRLMENYELYAVGASGERYLVDPSSLSPMETHWIQGRLCYATDERSVTGIYGVSGSHRILTVLEGLDSPEKARELYRKARPCTDPKRRAVFDEFIQRYFANLNQKGRPHRWLEWIGRPSHIWIHPQGRLYDLQERVTTVELWRTIVYHHGGGLHRLEQKRLREVPIPQ
jgi:hypothetical protein